MTETTEQKEFFPFPIAIVTSRFNKEITESLFKGAMQRLKTLGFNENHITTKWVPGGVEIPIVVQRLARTNNYKAIIALSAVIRGQTSHFDYVCQQLSYGCQRVALEYDVPVIFGVLTTDNAEQARARSGGSKSHKGIEAVDAACEMVAVLHSIEQ